MKCIAKISIHQPLERVYNYIIDHRNEIEWNPDLLAIEGYDPATWDEGSRCTMVFKMGEGDEPGSKVEIEVTDLTPNSSYGFRSTHGRSFYLFKGNAERCKILFETEVSLSGLMMKTLKRAAVRRSIEDRLERNFNELKAVLESTGDLLEGGA